MAAEMTKKNSIRGESELHECREGLGMMSCRDSYYVRTVDWVSRVLAKFVAISSSSCGISNILVYVVIVRDMRITIGINIDRAVRSYSLPPFVSYFFCP